MRPSLTPSPTPSHPRPAAARSSLPELATPAMRRLKTGSARHRAPSHTLLCHQECSAFALLQTRLPERPPHRRGPAGSLGAASAPGEPRPAGGARAASTRPRDAPPRPAPPDKKSPEKHLAAAHIHLRAPARAAAPPGTAGRPRARRAARRARRRFPHHSTCPVFPIPAARRAAAVRPRAAHDCPGARRRHCARARDPLSENPVPLDELTHGPRPRGRAGRSLRLPAIPRHPPSRPWAAAQAAPAGLLIDLCWPLIRFFGGFRV